PAQRPVSSDNWFQDVLTTVMSDEAVDAGLYLMTTQPDMVGAAGAFVAAQQASSKPMVFINAASSCGAEPVARVKAAGLSFFTGLPDAVTHLRHRLQYQQRCQALAAGDTLPQLDEPA